ncbi:hypothetical protein [Amaricoccus sp.]|uniref:hypothetical protein n=1 Tax=Amaricoccus sp. TaxID=1872485 RepID=UPI001B7ABC3C|nr:hypothetical protein [Amaricoccus sp.]MBP7243008.1 hypothetical protein [Amaricoccus sp.]
MSLGRARRLVTLSGVVVTATAALALWQVGGPETSRQQTRDMRRIDDLQAISGALECHLRGAAQPARPAALAEISPACLAPGRAAELVDPRTGAPYAIAYPEPGLATICASFEGPPVPRPWTAASFDAATGCLSVGLGLSAPDRRSG